MITHTHCSLATVTLQSPCRHREHSAADGPGRAGSRLLFAETGEGDQDLLRPVRQIRVGLEGPEERQVPYAASGVSPAPDQLKDRPDLRLGKLVHHVMQFLTHRVSCGQSTSTDWRRQRALPEGETLCSSARSAEG